MGLDMYLRAKVSAPGYRHARDEERERYARIVEAVGLERAVPEDTAYLMVSVAVAYWRKANAIHRWFVENVQGGQDDCGEYYVSREQLEELRDLCRGVLAVAEIAEDQPVHSGTTYRKDGTEEHFVKGRAILNGDEVSGLLPTRSGFFFGSTGYDEWYLKDLEQTVEALDRVLAEVGEGATLYYSSSW